MLDVSKVFFYFVARPLQIDRQDSSAKRKINCLVYFGLKSISSHPRHQFLIQFKMLNHWTAIENVKSLVLLLISHLLQLVFYALPSKQTEII